MYKVSVIIPIFNAEEYLERSINSVINQTLGFENIELILVDDKSTDNSKSIIEDFANKYDNIKPIFLEKNTGWASVPRNMGIRSANSNYIMFMDSDDEYHKDLCEKLYETLLSEDADLVSCNHYRIDDVSVEKISLDYNFGNAIVDDDKVIFNNENVLLFDNIVIWNKIFKKNIIIDNNIEFYEDIAEDFMFCMEYLAKINKRIYLKDYYGYNKFLQNDSLITKVDFESIKNKLEVFYYIHSLIINRIDKNEVQFFTNTIFKEAVKWIIEEASNIIDYDDCLDSLKLLYEFENNISFSADLDNGIINIINKLILKKRFKTTILILKCANFSKKSNFIKKCYRLIS